MKKTTAQLLFKILILITSTSLLQSAIAQTCDDTARVNNRGIEKLAFKYDTNGDVVLQANVGVFIGRSNENGTNLSFDLNISVNGELLDLVSEDVLYNGAIKCIVTCASDCPSIFGDGVCTGCGCDYGDWFAIPLPGIQSNDLVSVELVAARGGEKERDVRDDVMRIVFDRDAI